MTDLDKGGSSTEYENIAFGPTLGWIRTAVSDIPGFIPLTPNGVDDTAAINAAISKCTATNSGFVYLGPGLFQVASTIVLPTTVFLVGAGKRSTTIQAISGTFPTSTAVIQLGNPSTPVFDCGLRNLLVDANQIAGSICVDIMFLNEGCGLFSVCLEAFRDTGLRAHTPVSIHYTVQDLEVYPSLSANFGIDLVGPGGGFSDQGGYYVQITVNPATPITAGMRVNNVQLTATTLHFETCIDGLLIQGRTGGVVTYVNADNCTNVVHYDNTSGSALIEIIGIQDEHGGNTNLVKDDITNVTIVTGAYFQIEYYSHALYFTAGNVNNQQGIFHTNTQGIASYQLNSAGSNYGKIQNDGADLWSLAYGTGFGTLGTPVVQWNGSGQAFVPPGIIDAEQVLIQNGTRTFTNNTSPQAIFNASANGAVTLAATTAYEFEMLVAASGFSGSAHSLSLSFVGTATFTSIGYHYIADAGSTLAGPNAASEGFVAVATAVAVTASVTTTGLNMKVRGTMRINGTGTVIPTLTQNTASAAAVVQTNSFFRCWPVGTNTMTTVGNWS